VVAVRPFVWPAAFLAAATIAVVGVRAATKHKASPPAAHTTHRVVSARYYRVRAGDTLGSIAGRTGVSVSHLRRLNPKVTPTALFLGQRIRLR
jgi:LysM repeat protein